MFVIVGLKPFGTSDVLTNHIVHEHYNVKASTKINSEIRSVLLSVKC